MNVLKRWEVTEYLSRGHNIALVNVPVKNIKIHAGAIVRECSTWPALASTDYKREKKVEHHDVVIFNAQDYVEAYNHLRVDCISRKAWQYVAQALVALDFSMVVSWMSGLPEMQFVRNVTHF